MKWPVGHVLRLFWTYQSPFVSQKLRWPRRPSMHVGWESLDSRLLDCHPLHTQGLVGDDSSP